MAAMLRVAAALLLALVVVAALPGGRAAPSKPGRHMLSTKGRASPPPPPPRQRPPPPPPQDKCKNCPTDWVNTCLMRECAGNGTVKLTVNTTVAGCNNWASIVLTPTTPSKAESCVLKVDKTAGVVVTIATELPCGSYDILVKQVKQGGGKSRKSDGDDNKVGCELEEFLDDDSFKSDKTCSISGTVPKEDNKAFWDNDEGGWCEYANINVCQDLTPTCNDNNVCTDDISAANCTCTFTNNNGPCTPTSYGGSSVVECQNGGVCSDGSCIAQYKGDNETCDPLSNSWGVEVVSDCKDRGLCNSTTGACDPKLRSTGSPCNVTAVGDESPECIYGECTVTGECPTLFKNSSTNCGNSPTDLCDAQDTCGDEGNQGQCVDRLVPQETFCGNRSLANCCDAVDVCNGIDKFCPDTVQSNQTSCLTVKERINGTCQDTTYYCQGNSATCNYQPPANFLYVPPPPPPPK